MCVLFKKKKEERDFIKIFFFVRRSKKCMCFFCVVQLNSFFSKLISKVHLKQRTRRALFCRIVVVLLKVFLSLSPFCLTHSLSLFFFVKDLRNGVAR